MGAKVTMRDVAREAGVSPMTVSRAFKQDTSVNAETRSAVQKAAAKLGYLYDSTAQAFRSQRSGFLAVTLPSINNANFASTHRALTRTLAGTDLQLLLGITNYRVEEEERARDEHHPEGVADPGTALARPLAVGAVLADKHVLPQPEVELHQPRDHAHQREDEGHDVDADDAWHVAHGLFWVSCSVEEAEGRGHEAEEDGRGDGGDGADVQLADEEVSLAVLHFEDVHVVHALAEAMIQPRSKQMSYDGLT